MTKTVSKKCQPIPLYHIVFLCDTPGLAGVWGVEVVQQSHTGGGARRVSFYPDALHFAANPAASSAASLLFYQLLSRPAPRGDSSHSGCGLLSRQR